MSILEQIENEFSQAFKNREENVISTLRLFLAALKNEKIKKKEDLSDDDVIKILKSEIKQRNESINAYDKANRDDLSAKEKAELTILEKYLPQQMSEDQVKEKVQQVLKKIENKKNFGQVMGKVMKELKGQADGSIVKKIVEEEIEK